jgi:hypothetical protein
MKRDAAIEYARVIPTRTNTAQILKGYPAAQAQI